MSEEAKRLEQRASSNSSSSSLGAQEDHIKQQAIKVQQKDAGRKQKVFNITYTLMINTIF